MANPRLFARGALMRKNNRPTDKYIRYAKWVDDVAERLNQAILDDGRSVAAICKECNVDPHSLERYRRGYILPQLPTFKAICDALGVNMSEVVKD